MAADTDSVFRGGAAGNAAVSFWYSSCSENGLSRKSEMPEMRQFAGADNEALAAILEVLLKDHRQNLQLLQEAAAAGEWQQVGLLAHRMQTAFKHLKAQSITPALSELEQLLHQPAADTSHLPAVLAQLSLAIEQVLEALAQEAATIRATEEAVV